MGKGSGVRESIYGTRNEHIDVRATIQMPPRRWSGDETNFRRCLYKSDLVTSAGTVSAADALSLNPSQTPSAGCACTQTPSFSNGPLAEWLFKAELKRGSIFIRRFLMKPFKCMKLAVV